MPQKFGEQDIEAIALLIAIADGKPLPVDGFHANLVKSSEHEANVNLNMVKNLQVQLTSDHLDPVPVVFGKAVSTGPITVFGIGSVKDGAEFLERYAQAKYGEAVPIDFNVSELRSQLGKNGDPNLFVRPIPNLTPDSAQVAPSETNSDE